MPRYRSGTRRPGGAGHLRADERERIRELLAEGLSIVEVWAQCGDEGISPPQEDHISRILREPETQDLIKAKQAYARAQRIGRVTQRTAQRQARFDYLERVRQERANHYDGSVPGGSTGLVVLTKVQLIPQGKDAPPDTVKIHALDAAWLEEAARLENDQAREEDRVRRNLREDRREGREVERHQMDLDLTRVEVELLEKARAQDAGDESGAGSEAGPVGGAAHGAGPQILVVDDDPPASPPPA